MRPGTSASSTGSGGSRRIARWLIIADSSAHVEPGQRLGGAGNRLARSFFDLADLADLCVVRHDR